LFVVSIIVFGMIRLIPGSVVDAMLVAPMGEMSNFSEEQARAAIEAKLGLDVPILVQYGRWLRDLFLHGDLGESMWSGQPVTEQLIDRFPVSIELGVLAVLIGLIISVPIGVYSAIRQDTAGDYIARSFAIGMVTIPHFWIGIMVMVLPAVYFGWTPSMVYIPLREDPLGHLQMFLIPAAILGMLLAGATMRMTRTMMLEVLRQDYIRTAWSKGLKERQVVIRHGLKNALIPVVTLIGLQVPILIGGSIVLEQIFNLPGIGRLTVSVISNRDYPVLSGINLVLAAGILFFNLIIDLTYAWLDPRIKYS
jgi:peptide/nickel transport system permease protein